MLIFDVDLIVLYRMANSLYYSGFLIILALIYITYKNKEQ